MSVTITWERHDAGIFIPVITDGVQVWRSHCSVSHSTDQVDGHVDGRTLDLWFVDGPGVADLCSDYPGEVERAHHVWDEGQVLHIGLWPLNDHGIPSFLIPGEHFTDELACAAFERWWL